MAKKWEYCLGKIDPSVQFPFFTVFLEAPFPKSCMENFMLERLNVSKTIEAPRDGDCLALIVGYAFTFRVSIRGTRFVIRDHILHAGAILQAANADRGGGRGIPLR